MADVVKIENYEGTANTFTFPYNPQSLQSQSRTYNQSTDVPYSNFHVFIGNRSLKPKQLSFSGHFSTSNKDEDWENLARNLQEGSKLKKIYFRDDRFQIVLGIDFQKNHVSNRTNFLDYVFSCQTPIPLVFGSTLKTASDDGSGTSWTNGTASNDGGTFTYIEEVEFTISEAVTSGDTITISSDNDTGITITFTDGYSIGETFTLFMIKYEKTAGLYQTKYWQCEDSSGNKQGRRKESGKDELSLRLEKDEQIDSYSVSGTTVSNITFNFRDGYNGE